MTAIDKQLLRQAGADIDRLYHAADRLDKVLLEYRAAHDSLRIARAGLDKIIKASTDPWARQRAADTLSLMEGG